MTTVVHAFDRLADRIGSVAARLAWLPPLVARVVLGVAFLRTGWGKIHNLDGVATFFTSLGIPAPGVHAALVAGVELGGGALLLAGLATRAAALPLAGTMVVATATAQWPQAESILDLTATIELAYLALLVWLVQAGAGALSLDRLVARRLRRPGA
jgi:putative oxidoreductase